MPASEPIPNEKSSASILPEAGNEQKIHHILSFLCLIAQKCSNGFIFVASIIVPYAQVKKQEMQQLRFLRSNCAKIAL
ncbi:MAG: hypothetical protein NZM37_03080 [Sandaracinaceae bacterium]|nr:hypothetical protein [Sandaracinaceae bacterium]MDW8246127.1 hypothetical protein [Sandaracinaceae bacterium]